MYIKIIKKIEIKLYHNIILHKPELRMMTAVIDNRIYPSNDVYIESNWSKMNNVTTTIQPQELSMRFLKRIPQDIFNIHVMSYIRSPQPENLLEDICSFVKHKQMVEKHVSLLHGAYYNDPATNDPSDPINEWQIGMLDGFINEELELIAPKNYSNNGPSYAYINIWKRHRKFLNKQLLVVYLFIIEKFDNGDIVKFPAWIRFNMLFGLMTPMERASFVENLITQL